MSQLLTREAIEQAGTLITHKGNTVVPAAGTIGVASGGNGCLITFDQSNSQISIGDNSNNAYLQLFTTSGDTAIRDSANASLLAFTADSSPVNFLSIKNAAASSEPQISALGTDTDVSVAIVPKGAGTLHLKKASAPSSGIDFSAGSSGTDSYILRGPQDGLQNVDASITLPTFTSAPSLGHVLKVSAATGTTITTEWAADSGALTYSAITTGTTQTAAVNTIYALVESARSAVFTVTLPSSPSAGDVIQVVDAVGIAGTASTNIVIDSAQNINGSAADFTLEADFGSTKFLAVSISGVPAYVAI